MKFINKEHIQDLDNTVSHYTSLQFQTRYDVITNPNNVEEAYFSVLCACIPSHTIKVVSKDEKMKHFEALYQAISQMVRSTEAETTKVVAKYTPSEDPAIVEIFIEEQEK